MKAFIDRSWLRRGPGALLLVLLIACAGCGHSASRVDRDTVLNELRDEISANYGVRNGWPHINCGPCARFAIAFRERWNSRFREKVHLVCVLTSDRNGCGHVALKFADGSYYDGGNGVISEQQLRTLYPDFPIEDMIEFDRDRLDRLVGGLDHDYTLSAQITRKT